MASILDELAVIAAVNREDVLARDLMASPLLASDRVERFFCRGARNIGEAYHAGVENTAAEYMIFAHQDVYFPDGWHLALQQAIETLAQKGENWAVLGCFGITAEGVKGGHVWSSGLQRELKPAFQSPLEVCCLDELVLVVRRSSGVRFDRELPHFHLYGTDIVQIARAAGYTSFVIDAPVVHNSDQIFRLDQGYRQAYDYMYRKWQDDLPIKTLIGRISHDQKALRRVNRQAMSRYLRSFLPGRGGPNRGVDDPVALAKRLGFQ
ncbi:glycosyltransferase [Roseobacter sp. MH60115]|uniref:glycosyltransferase n=1 Tax=Roseobacter sp. MH60115 TaxID=2785324 RepID=UPI0018A2B38F|nr:glycosyltransferase [Roseobacter sp. MH60115]